MFDIQLSRNNKSGTTLWRRICVVAMLFLKFEAEQHAVVLVDESADGLEGSVAAGRGQLADEFEEFVGLEEEVQLS